MTQLTPNRRDILAGCIGAGLLTLPGLSVAQARTVSDRKLIVILLRGALDGLAALAPVGDRNYARLRSNLALQDGFEIAPGFLLHPRLQVLHDLWLNGELIVLPATATGYRERSHFDGQDRLESGTDLIRDGWLNRALSLQEDAPTEAIAIGQSIPLILRGQHPVSSWSPNILPQAADSTVSRLMDLYQSDESLAQALSMAIETQQIADGETMSGQRMSGPAAARYAQTAEAAANLLSTPGGPGLAVLGFEGWDTHVRQGAEEGLLANRLGELDRAIDTLRQGLGPDWSNTAVMIMTEFGRTVRANGAGGTDHGTAGTAFLLGGAVNGGRLVGDWPGLSQLHENRDLIPANVTEHLCKTVLSEHWGLDFRALDQHVFPETAPGSNLSGLIR